MQIEALRDIEQIGHRDRFESCAIVPVDPLEIKVNRQRLLVERSFWGCLRVTIIFAGIAVNVALLRIGAEQVRFLVQETIPGEVR